MTVDPIARLVAANPVPEPPTVEPVERLRCLIEDALSTDEQSALVGEANTPARERSTHAKHRRRVLPRVLAGALVAGGIGLVIALLVGGSSAPGLNVAAAAYAATSPGSGVVEAEFLVSSYEGGRLVGTFRQHEWVDSATDQRRELMRIDGVSRVHTRFGRPARPVHAVQDWVEEPKMTEFWVSGSEADVIRRILTSTSHEAGRRVDIEGMTFDGLQGIALYRRFYREGTMRLAGRVRVDGRLLWKLESKPNTPAVHSALTKLTVLVDPTTFLPVREMEQTFGVVSPSGQILGRLIALGRVESRLLRYRRLPVGRTSARLFDLAAQHPGARVVTASEPSAHVHRVSP